LVIAVSSSAFEQAPMAKAAVAAMTVAKRVMLM